MADIRKHLSTPVADAVVLAATVACALFVRLYFTRAQVFGGERVVFLSTDPWYHVRLIDGLVRHFPHAVEFDPYGLFPGGQDVPVAPLFDLLIAAAALVVGLGAPSEGLTHTVAAVAPAVLGALVPIPVYLLGRTVFDRTTALVAAVLVAVTPGEFLERSLAGYTDHHVAETLFWTLAVALFALAVGREREAWPKWFVLPMLAGVALGAYMLTWAHGAFLALVLVAWLVAQHAVERRAGAAAGGLLATAAVVFGAALVTVLPYATRADGAEYNVPVAALGLAVCGGLAAFDRVAARVGLGARGRTAALAGGAFAVAAAAYVAAPGLVRAALGAVGRFTLRPTTLTVLEARPLLLAADGSVSLAPAWSEFGPAGLLALVGLALVARRALGDRRRETTLVLVWSVALFAAVMLQIRFSYYVAVNVALLAAFACVELSRKRIPRWFSIPALAVLVVLPTAALAVARAKAAGGGPHGDWIEALSWMRDATPEPLGSPDAYYARYGARAGYAYPATAYGVMNWWDTGYWITAIGRRIPASNPTQAGAREAARFFLAQDEATAVALVDAAGARYVVVDSNLPILRYPEGDRGGFTGFPAWAGEDETRYFETYVSYATGKRQEVRCFYPEYYRSMCVRLYCFGGRAVAPSNSTWVVSFVERTGAGGARTKEATSAQPFATYEAAEAFVAGRAGQNVRIVGTDPLASCVPLDALERFRLVHASPSAIVAGQLRLPWVQIFEYTGP